MNKIIQGDSLTIIKTLPIESVNCVITSPPYWGLRDYGVDGQLGLEKTPEEYVANMVKLFSEVKRVLKDDGTLWLNLGDSYASDTKGSGGLYKDKGFAHQNDSKRFSPLKVNHGLKNKDLVGIPWRVAFALQADGWYLRQDIIWAKPNPMPESVTDRCTKSHEYIFLLSKSPKYFFDNEAIKEPTVTKDDTNRDRDTTKLNNVPGRTKMMGLKTNNYDLRNKRDVWTCSTKPFKEAHFATFPETLIEPMVKAGCPKGGIVLDPFMGAGTTALVAKKLGRNYLGCELNSEYIKIAEKRINNYNPLF